MKTLARLSAARELMHARAQLRRVESVNRSIWKDSKAYARRIRRELQGAPAPGNLADILEEIDGLAETHRQHRQLHHEVLWLLSHEALAAQIQAWRKALSAFLRLLLSRVTTFLPRDPLEETLAIRC